MDQTIYAFIFITLKFLLIRFILLHYLSNTYTVIYLCKHVKDRFFEPVKANVLHVF